ncbi:HAD-IC family P-type ATPase, partial [Desulfobulbus sp. TB]|nr:HAD-IC family P-type ATPase [Desulfobulbus sp. TB]
STSVFYQNTSLRRDAKKDGCALEKLSEVDTIVFDKTGTLTLNQLYVNKVYSYNGLSEKKLLTYAAAAEYRQNHPIANAILTAAYKQKISLPDIEDIRCDIGYGVKVNLSNQIIRVGSERFMKMENISVPDEIRSIQKCCHIKGYSVVMVAIDEEVSGAIELHPLIRPEAKQIIRLLRRQNISTYIISGDHEQPTRMLARELGVDGYFSDTLPEQKAQLVKKLQEKSKIVCFVGDGINDSIALRQADVSISLSGASVAAIDSAQIIFMEESLNPLLYLIDISIRFKTNQRVNLIISVIPSIICIGGYFYSILEYTHPSYSTIAAWLSAWQIRHFL